MIFKSTNMMRWAWVSDRSIRGSRSKVASQMFSVETMAVFKFPVDIDAWEYSWEPLSMDTRLVVKRMVLR